MEGANPTVLAGWSMAALLFGLALPASFGGGLRRGAHLMMAGMTVIGAVTLYSHDVMSMPQIFAALIMGGAVGLVLGRGMPRAAIPALLIGLIGQTGLAAMFVGVAAWRNPRAFGLLDEMTDQWFADDAAAIGVGVALGAMACAGAAAILWCRMGRRGKGRPGAPFFTGAMLAGTCGAVLAFVASPTTDRLLPLAGVALLAGWGLAKWTMGARMGPAAALVGGLSGWAVAVLAYLLENIGMAVAGGLAGAAGGLFALRLCGGADRKGLAEGGARP
ncbi:NAD(P)(+) transhydrogenase (Re/Si-specific) subunit beta [Sphingobium chungbukense]|nr:NAD(P)(+) transhydrogenase (Re/Si-specific) subunit beta [Sphingobium chungbukense]